MAGGAPGSSSRGRGGKFKKYTRGGGHHFSRNLQPLDAEGNAVSIWSVDKDSKKDDDDDSEEEDEDSEEEEDSDDEDPAAAAAKEEASREARKAQKKARKEAAIAKSRAKTVEVGDMPTSDEDEDSEDDEDDMPANPNHSKAARKQAQAPRVASGDEEDADVDQITSGVSNIQAGNRKEREALEAAAAKERYLKMQAQGKTDEAKADLARLKVIREQRAAEAARRQAEKEEREAQEKEKRAQIEAREAKKREAAAAPKKPKKK